MSCILHIDTSTNVCSVAVSENGGVIFNKENHSGPNHAESLGSDVDEALSFADSHAIPVDAVAISSGPGSYTGLRIGVSMAKGICYGQGLLGHFIQYFSSIIFLLLRKKMQVNSQHEH